MDFNLITIAFAIMLAILILVLLWGVGRAWKTNNKFIAFILLVLAIASGIGFYAIYGKKFFG